MQCIEGWCHCLHSKPHLQIHIYQPIGTKRSVSCDQIVMTAVNMTVAGHKASSRVPLSTRPSTNLCRRGGGPRHPRANQRQPSDGKPRSGRGTSYEPAPPQQGAQHRHVPMPRLRAHQAAKGDRFTLGNAFVSKKKAHVRESAVGSRVDTSVFSFIMIV